MRLDAEHRRGEVGDLGFAGVAGPAPDVAERDQRKAPEVALAAGVLQVGEQVVEVEAQLCRHVHVAVQHEVAC